MGLQFGAISSETRIAYDGREAPVWIKMPEEWELFGFHAAGVLALFWLLQEATNRTPALCNVFADRLTGTASLPDARRSIMLARARFDLLASEIMEEVSEVYRFEYSPGDLKVRLNGFAGFVEAAALAGADRITWS